MPSEDDRKSTRPGRRQVSRGSILGGFGRAVFLFMVAVAAVYALVAYVSGNGLGGPRNAEDVIAGVVESSAQSWISESVHTLTVGEQQKRSDATRNVVVDMERNRFQALVAGVQAEAAVYASDGTVTAMLGESAREQGGTWMLLNDVCANAPAIAASLLSWPSAEEVASGSPTLVADDAIAAGEDAYAITFTPSPELVKRLLWIDFFEAATPTELGWVVSPEELEQIEAGQFEVERAYAWFSHGKQRRWLAVSIVFETTPAEGIVSSWELIATRKQLPGTDVLAEMTFGETSC